MRLPRSRTPRRALYATPLALALSVLALPANAQQGGDAAQEIPTIESKTEGMEKLDGFMPVYWDEEEGKLWLEIARWDQDILHYTSLPAGFGQNDLGLNRGDLGGSRVVRFERAGPKVFMHEPNTRYRAITDDMERRSVEDGFPSAIHWGFEVAARDGRPGPGRRHRLLPARLARRDRIASALEPGHVPARRLAERALPPPHPGLSREHRGRGHADLHLRSGWRAGRERGRGRAAR
jgi:hypothetical protein